MAEDSPNDQVVAHPNQGVLSVSPLHQGCSRVLSVSPHETHTQSLSAIASPCMDERVIASSIAALQERLELSSQMLQAFQSQITRVEWALTELKAQERRAQVAEERAQQRLADIELRIDAASHRFTARLDELSHTTLRNVQSQIEQRVSKLPGISVGNAAILEDLSRLSAAMREAADNMALAAKAERPVPQEPDINPPLKFNKWASA